MSWSHFGESLLLSWEMPDSWSQELQGFAGKHGQEHDGSG